RRIPDASFRPARRMAGQVTLTTPRPAALAPRTTPTGPAVPESAGRWWLAAVLALVGAVGAGLLTGPAGLPVRGIVGDVAGRIPLVHIHSGLSRTDRAILWQLRLPRVVLGGLVGWTLGAAGAAYQGVFRNPLADPYLLGAAAGAGLGATLVITAGIHGSIGPFGTVQAAAFAGALAAVTVTWLLGRGRDRIRSTASLILAGVAVTAL